jgi:hypothetical protein
VTTTTTVNISSTNGTLVASDDGTSTLLSNQDPNNTIYLANDPTMDIAGLSDCVPLSPNGTVVMDGSEIWYAAVQAGLSADLAVIPGGVSYFQFVTLLLKSLIVDASAGNGIFVYNPTVGAGNLVASIAGEAGTDPYGDSYPAIAAFGIAGQGQTVITADGDILLYNAAGFPVIQLSPSNQRILIYGPVQAGNTLVGAYIKPAAFGSSVTYSQAVADWISSSYTDRPLPVRRLYYLGSSGTDPWPVTFADDPTLAVDVAAGRKVCMSFQPAFNPPTTSDLDSLNVFLTSCVDAGVVADVCLWHEAADATFDMSAAQFQTMIEFYGPSVSAFYPLVYCEDAYNVQVNDALSYVPSGNYFQKYTADIYAGEYYDSHSIRLTTFSAAADALGIPFGIWEYNGGSNVSESESQAFFAYIQSYFQSRVTNGLPNADILLFNDNGPESTPYITPGDFRLPLYQSMFDNLNQPATDNQYSLIGSWAAVSGVDNYGTPYKAGLFANGALIEAGQFIGTTMSLNPGPLLVYGNLSQVTEYISVGTTSWTAPIGVTTVFVEGKGSGGGSQSGAAGGFGGGGSEYAASNIGVTAGNVYTTQVSGDSAANGNGGSTTFFGDTKGITAHGGKSGSNGGLGGTGSTAEFHYPGGNGAAGYSGGGGGGGGSSAGDSQAGTNGQAGLLGAGGNGGVAPVDGGNGGGGGQPTNSLGSPGESPGGGAGGGAGTGAGNVGSSGYLRLTYTPSGGSGEQLAFSASPIPGIDPDTGDSFPSGGYLNPGQLQLENTAVPSTPSGGGILYVSGGALYYRGSSGDITEVAPA